MYLCAHRLNHTIFQDEPEPAASVARHVAADTVRPECEMSSRTVKSA